MKQLFLLIFFASNICLSQTFEGEVVYTIDWKSKTEQFTDKQWGQMMGNKMDYFIKNGDYKSVTNGALSQWQLYRNKENILYSKTSISEALKTTDVSLNEEKVISSVIKKNADTILGYICDELTLTCKSGIQKYYYSAKLSVNPKLYKKHNYANWYIYLSAAKAIPLKMVISNGQFTMETVATEVKPMKLENSYFVLPDNTKTQPNTN